MIPLNILLEQALSNGPGLIRQGLSAHELDSHINLTGLWVCRFDTFLFPGNVAMELYYIKQRGQKIKIYIQHYSSGPKQTVSKLVGHGIVCGKSVSAYYVTKNKVSDICGVLQLRLQRLGVEEYVLRGNMLENISALSLEQKKNITIKMSSEDILVLNKLELSSIQRFINYFKFYFGIKLFKNYNCFAMEK